MSNIIRRRELIAGSLPKKAFSACTWDEINKICEAGKAMEYYNDGTWSIGEENTTATYGSYSGVYLVHILEDTQKATYNTTGHIVVQFKNTITTSSWNESNSSVSYSASTLFSNLNGTVYDGLNVDFKAVLKQFGPPTSVQVSSSSSVTTSVENPMGYLHEPNCVEVGGSNSYRPSENSSSFELQWYKNGGSLLKSGASNAWWLRSPSRYQYDRSLNLIYTPYIIWTSGAISDSYYPTSSYGVAPLACI